MKSCWLKCYHQIYFSNRLKRGFFFIYVFIYIRNHKHHTHINTARHRAFRACALHSGIFIWIRLNLKVLTSSRAFTIWNVVLRVILVTATSLDLYTIAQYEDNADFCPGLTTEESLTSLLSTLITGLSSSWTYVPLGISGPFKIAMLSEGGFLGMFTPSHYTLS